MVSTCTHVIASFKKVHRVLGQMTPRVSKVRFLTGLYLMANLWILLSHATSRQIAASTTNAPVLCYAQPEWTGPILSKFSTCHIVSKCSLVVQCQGQTSKWRACDTRWSMADLLVCWLWLWPRGTMERPVQKFCTCVCELCSQSLISSDQCPNAVKGLQTHLHITELRWQGS